MNMEFKPSVEKLMGASNWTRWKQQMLLLLRHHDVLDHVTSAGTEPEVEHGASEEDVKKIVDENKAFFKADALAMLILVNGLNDSNAELTATCQTAVEVWTKLLSVYEQTSGQRVDRLMEEFFTSTLRDNEDIITFVSRLEKSFCELNNELIILHCDKLPDLLLMSRIMSALPVEYFEFKSVWESIEPKDRSVNYLTERLRLIEMRLPSRETPVSTALVANKNNVHSQADASCQDRGKNQVRCYRCNKLGHFKKDCRRRSQDTRTEEDTNMSVLLCCTAAANDVDVNGWIADSGASRHMAINKQDFKEYKEFPVPCNVKMGNGGIIQAFGCGTIPVKVTFRKWSYETLLTDVWYVPDLCRNLFSVSQAVKKGYTFTIERNICRLVLNGKVKLCGSVTSSGLYKLHMKLNRQSEALLVQPMKLWHERLCHQNVKHVKEVLLRHSIKATNSSEEDLCYGCVHGKHQRKKFTSKTPLQRASTPGYVHADLCGPMQKTSLGGARYMLVFKDDFSSYRRVFFLKQKNEVAINLGKFLLEAETAGVKIRSLMTDGGGEFVNSSVKKILDQKGINLRVTMPYTPQQNGLAERENRTLIEAARSMIHGRNLPLSYWAEAVNTACHVLNRTGDTKIAGKSPIEVWNKNYHIKINHWRVFGSECYYHVPKENRRKWDKKSKSGIFVGYCDEADGYRIYIPEEHRVITSRDVIFKENITFDIKQGQSSRGERIERNVTRNTSNNGERFDDICKEDERYDDTWNDQERSDEHEIEDEETIVEQPAIASSRSGRQVKLPQRFSDYVMSAEKIHDCPTSFEDALCNADASSWLDAMVEEIQSLADNQVYDLVDLPPGKKIIKTRWVFAVKTGADGSIQRYKARLVAKGYAQRYGIDFEETFSPVARFDTIRALLAVAALQKLHLQQFDVKTAFLYGDLEEEVYIQQPRGFEDGTNRVCKLKKSLYGLKQAPRCWNKRLLEFFRKQGLVQSEADPCLFSRHQEEGKRLFIAVYVDDGIVAADNDDEIHKFLSEMKKEFSIRSGSVDSFLGMGVHVSDAGIFY